MTERVYFEGPDGEPSNDRYADIPKKTFDEAVERSVREGVSVREALDDVLSNVVSLNEKPVSDDDQEQLPDADADEE